MISRYTLPVIFLLACKAHSESEEIVNAKWFYYAYAMEQNGYSSNGEEIKPLTCDIKLNLIKHISSDTTNFYFSLYQKDTLNICYLKPLGLVGISTVKNKFYTPIYHSVIFDREGDSLILDKMNKKSLLLLQRSLVNDEDINSWLQEEAKRRKSN